jgi:uncharacterized membrane protein YfcA
VDDLLTYTLLCISALLAGAVNAIAGGGTLLTFPALLGVLLGAEGSVLANATSTVALLPGSLAGSLGYRKELKAVRRLILWLTVPSLVGGIVGALFVTRFPPHIFQTLIPWLILAASLLFLIQGPIKRLTGVGTHGPPQGITIIFVILGQFVIAVYGGYFGAGIGIFMLSVLPFMGTGNIHETNAAKTILAALINAVTVAVFIIDDKVVWGYALPMAVTAIIGGYLGAHYARQMRPVVVKGIVITIGFVLSAYYLWKTFAN